MLNKLAASELVLNDDGSVYHLNLLPEDIADKIIISIRRICYIRDSKNLSNKNYSKLPR